MNTNSLNHMKGFNYDNSNNNKFSLKVSQPYCSTFDFNNNNWIPTNMYWINDYNKYSDISKYIIQNPPDNSTVNNNLNNNNLNNNLNNNNNNLNNNFYNKN